MNTQLEQLTLSVERLQQANTDLDARMNSMELHSRRERRKLRIQAGLAFTGFLAAVFVSPGNRAAIAQGAGSLEARIAALEYKTQFMSADATAQSTTFSGCNVFINDGGGSTDAIVRNAAGNGIGNLIIGYNSSRSFYGIRDVRNGSHNLIVGDLQDYSSYGGLVAGYYNNLTGPHASISGGVQNTASGINSSASGGGTNIASGFGSSVSGGYNNTAMQDGTSISGGYSNTAK